MRYGHHLHILAQRVDYIAHSIGNAARDTGINLIKDDGRELGLLRQKCLERQHNTRNLTARSNLLYRLGCNATIGREHIADTVHTRVQKLLRSRDLNLETGLSHTELREHLNDALRHLRRCLLAQGVNLGGTLLGLRAKRCNLLTLSLDTLIAMGDGRELLRKARTHLHKLFQIGHAVLLTHRVDKIYPVC